MNKNNWIKGALVLGLSFFIAIFLVKPVGVSTQFSVVSGIIYSTVDKNVITEDKNNEYGYSSTNEYFNKSEGKLAHSIKNPLNYDLVFVLAIPLGGLLGYRFSKRKNINSSCPTDENSCHINNNKKSFIRKYAPTFLGGFLLLFGARMADGCTSGHMMSGMMQGSVSGYAFAFSVFLTAIPTSILVKKLKHSK